MAPARCPFPWYTDVSVIGNSIAVRGRAANGGPLYWKTTYQPTLAIPSATPTQWSTLDGRPAQLVSFPNIKEMYIWEETQAASSREVHGSISPIYQCIGSSFAYPIPYDLNAIKVDYVDIEVEAEDKFPNPEQAAYPVNVISYFSRGVMHVWGTQSSYVPDRTDIAINYTFCQNEHDLLQDFLVHYTSDYPDVISGWNTGGFDIPYLYNRICKIFDADSANLLSPYKQMRQRRATIYGKEKTFLDIVGVAHLDYLEIYKKFTYTQQESYRLDYIAHVELKERKLAFAEYSSLHELAKKDWQKFVAYNIQDTYLVVRLEEKLKFIQLIATLAYTARTNFLDTFKQVRMWDAMMYYALSAQNIVIPPKPQRDKVDQYAGAYVKDPKPGAYTWVMSFDVNSLYPSLMRQFNISPDRHIPREDLEMRAKQNGPDAADLQTILTTLDQITPDVYLTTPEVLRAATPALERLNLTMTPNKQCFRTDIGDGVLPTLLAEAYDARVSAKKKQIAAEQELSKETDADKKRELGFTVTRWKNEQTSRKVQLNSAYGSVGNQHFRYYDVRQAEAVTISGQMIIRAVEQHLNRWLNGVMGTTDVDYIIASDTDSVYLHLGPMVEQKFPAGMTDDAIATKLDAFAQKFIEPQINSVFEAVAKDTHAHKSLMVMKREAIGRRGVWTGKKHYIIDLLDQEGVRYKEPKLKMMGIEAVKSSTPTACRTYIKKAMEIFMRATPDELHEFVKKCWTEFQTLPYEDIAFPRGLNGLDKYAMDGDRFAPKTPIQVRGALVYNNLIVDQRLDKKYSLLHDGDKIKFCYLRIPNTARSDIISAPGGLPTEWAQSIGAMLDYDKQFEKGFLSPLKAIVECAGWTTEPVNDLDSLFA